MNNPPRFSLFSKMLGWLLLHFLLLSLAFGTFVAWQLRLGLDSLLSGATGERLRALGEMFARDFQTTPENQWRDLLSAEAKRRGVGLDVWHPHHGFRNGLLQPPPDNIRRRLDQALPPGNSPPVPPLPGATPQGPAPQGPAPQGPAPQGPAPQGPRPSPGNFLGQPLPFRGDPPPGSSSGPSYPNPLRAPTLPPSNNFGRQPARPAFFARGDGGDGYWAAVIVPLDPASRPQGPGQLILAIRSDQLSGNGLFFDLQPWLLGGLAVLVLSLAFWAPFFAAISRYLRQLTKATGRIAQGEFHVAIDTRRHDELGQLGLSIQSMAARLDHLLAGQKRFLGDVAHELCSPLARLRTGLGILEQHLEPAHRPHLDTIETEAAELAVLIEEILAFSRAAAGHHARCHPVALAPLVARAAARECPDLPLEIAIPETTTALADERLLERAVANVLRNSRRYAGPHPRLRASTQSHPDQSLALCLDDDGPGVPAAELPHLFEPFYRPDSARSRDHGGTGLGLAIVRSCLEACHGSASAQNLCPRGFRVQFLLPAPNPAPELLPPS